MSVEENIAYLDSLVKIIAPGIFALTVVMVLLEVVILMFRKVQMNHKGGAVSLISGIGVFGFEAVADFLFYLALSYGCTNTAFLNSDLNGMYGYSVFFYSISFFIGAIAFSMKCVCFGVFILPTIVHPRCDFLLQCAGQ